MTHKLLIVDDELPNLRLLERLFAKDFQVLTAPSGPEAIRLLEQHDVAILITDQRMPEMTGIELLKRSARLRPHMVRILLTGYTDLEALVEAINSGLVYMYITKPWNNDDLKVRVSRASEHYQHNKNRSALEDGNRRLLLRLNEVKLGVVGALTEMLRVRDNHAADHALRVRNYAMMIATKLGISQEQEEDLSIAALLHDLGRIDTYRNRATSSRKSSVDQTLIQGYSECEARLLHAVPELANVAEIVTSLRENYDGTGTPRGLKAEQIPLSSRILRLADEYDQMILPEASASLTHDEAMRFLTQRSGKQFDPMVVEVLTQFSPEDLGERLDSIPTYGEHNRLRQDSYDPAFVDSVL
ncbi:MAG TPA: HD domain-containing phosphohydrolase [Pyrinomonadaceae bacterium]